VFDWCSNPHHSETSLNRLGSSGDWTMTPAAALYTYEINIPLIRQSPELPSLFREVSE